MGYKPKDISCNRLDCFAYKDGNCVALNDTNFKGRPCPFYKPVIKYEEKAEEKK